MDEMQDLAGRDDSAATSAASLWNIIVLIVPVGAKSSSTDRRHGSASTTEEGEIGRSSAEWRGIGRRDVGTRNLRSISSKTHAGTAAARPPLPVINLNLRK